MIRFRNRIIYVCMYVCMYVIMYVIMYVCDREHCLMLGSLRARAWMCGRAICSDCFLLLVISAAKIRRRVPHGHAAQPARPCKQGSAVDCTRTVVMQRKCRPMTYLHNSICLFFSSDPRSFREHPIQTKRSSDLCVLLWRKYWHLQMKQRPAAHQKLHLIVV